MESVRKVLQGFQRHIWFAHFKTMDGGVADPHLPGKLLIREVDRLLTKPIRCCLWSMRAVKQTRWERFCVLFETAIFSEVAKARSGLDAPIAEHNMAMNWAEGQHFVGMGLVDVGANSDQIAYVGALETLPIHRRLP
jgi:hypothetical protein